jgi:hypothetical protein
LAFGSTIFVHDPLSVLDANRRDETETGTTIFRDGAPGSWIQWPDAERERYGVKVHEFPRDLSRTEVRWLPLGNDRALIGGRGGGGHVRAVVGRRLKIAADGGEGSTGQPARAA